MHFIGPLQFNPAVGFRPVGRDCFVVVSPQFQEGGGGGGGGPWGADFYLVLYFFFSLFYLAKRGCVVFLYEGDTR